MIIITTTASVKFVGTFSNMAAMLSLYLSFIVVTTMLLWVLRVLFDFTALELIAFHMHFSFDIFVYHMKINCGYYKPFKMANIV